MVLGLLGKLAEPVLDIIDKSVKDKDEAEKIKAKVVLAFNNSADELVKVQGRIIEAEATGESWLQRNWRPILMLSVVAIVVNNYLLVPYLSAFGLLAVPLELPPELFNLMTVGVGGYVVGRSGEKIAASWNKDK